MCGICGLIFTDRQRCVTKDSMKPMVDAIVHRGPDDEGFFIQGPVGLGMRRLSVIDIAGGKQPVYNEDKMIVVVYNGEIYNYRELRNLLEKKGHAFRSNVDTEILVHLYEEYGQELLGRLNGMFAFALYDRRNNTLLIARDRLGVKPLYYWYDKNTFAFGSEVKSIRLAPGFSAGVDTEAMHQYLTFRFVPSPLTMFSGVRKLEPGHYLRLRVDGFDRKSIMPVRYWDVDLSRPDRKISFTDACGEIKSLVDDSVSIRLRADVPLGVMLSGGVDSAIVTQAATAASVSGRVETFTIDYTEEGIHREREYAALAARKFGTNHHEIIIRFDEFMSMIDRIVFSMDEPIADPAAMPIYELCRFSRKMVTVLLSGIGGDEVFAGYPLYSEAIYRSWLRCVPRFVWRNLVYPFYSLLPINLPGKNFVNRLSYPLERLFLGSSPIYGGFSEEEKFKLYNEEFGKHQLNALSSHALINTLCAQQSGTDELKKMQYIDLKYWLAESHLVMMDKMSMAHGLEIREPLLDYRLVEASFSLPSKFKKTLSDSKKVLREAYSGMIPSEIANRKKQGFSTPLDIWFRKNNLQLRDHLVLSSAKIHDFVSKEYIDQLIKSHCSRHGDFSPHLFTLCVLESWLKIWSTNTVYSLIKQ